MSFYVDVHTHLTHEKFACDWQDVVNRAKTAGLGAIVVNGLEPASNRQLLGMARNFAIIKPACGIYPVDAVADLLPDNFPWLVPRFDVDHEINFIKNLASTGQIIAIGECGLDGHWLDVSTFAQQESVFERLVDIAIQADIPVIVHSRKREQRAIEILQHMSVKKVDFHCFGGKTKLALKASEDHGWVFSIPANAAKQEAFCKLLKLLPSECILTETDAPFLSPERETRNEPANVIHTVNLLAHLRGWDLEKAKQVVWENYKRLFDKM